MAENVYFLFSYFVSKHEWHLCFFVLEYIDPLGISENHEVTMFLKVTMETDCV